MVREAGIRFLPGETKWGPLAQHFRLWQKEGLDLAFIEDMVKEFVKHPEWCRKSNRAPWLVFLSRRTDLVSRVARQRQRDEPGRHRVDGDWWLTTTPRDEHRDDADWWLAPRRLT
jgi:hypothetical protein